MQNAPSSTSCSTSTSHRCLRLIIGWILALMFMIETEYLFVNWNVVIKINVHEFFCIQQANWQPTNTQSQIKKKIVDTTIYKSLCNKKMVLKVVQKHQYCVCLLQLLALFKKILNLMRMKLEYLKPYTIKFLLKSFFNSFECQVKYWYA